MKNIGKKVVAVLGVTTILGTSIFAGASAAGTELRGKIMKMNIFNNGSAITIPQDQQPIIVNNRTYLPVRALGEALGRQVDWYANDPNSIYISGSANEAQYNQMALDLNQTRLQIAEKDSKIKDLEAKIKNLEEELKKKDDVSTLSDLEKKLEKELGKYKDIYFDIRVKGTEKRIDIQVTVDKRDEKDWDDLSIKNKEDYIKDLVYETERMFKKSPIEGSIYSGSSITEIFFEVDSRGNLYIDDWEYSSGSRGKLTSTELTRLERDLELDFSSDIAKASIKDDGDYMNVEVELKNSYLLDYKYEIEDEIESYLVRRFDRKDIYVKAYY